MCPSAARLLAIAAVASNYAYRLLSTVTTASTYEYLLKDKTPLLYNSKRADDDDD